MLKECNIFQKQEALKYMLCNWHSMYTAYALLGGFTRQPWKDCIFRLLLRFAVCGGGDRRSHISITAMVRCVWGRM